MIHTHRFDNGLTLVVEPMANVASCAMTFLMPAGAVYEPADRQGTASVLAEMMLRGAGDLGPVDHAHALDALGVRRSCESATWHLRVGATLMGDRFGAALPLLLDMVRRPHLADDAFEPSRQLALQEIEGLEDEPQDKVMVELKRRHLRDPAGRSPMGRIEDLRALTAEEVRRFHAERLVPDRAILSLAGRVDPEDAVRRVESLLGDFAGRAPEEPAVRCAAAEAHHLASDSAQLHIGMASQTVGERDAGSMAQRLAIAVLSGGMSGRLFTEVREKRGLCYSVYATYQPHRETGTIYAYSGTMPDRAGETRRVLADELRRLAEGVEADELERARTGLRSRLIMQGESTSARAAAMAGDVYLRGAPRTLEEIAAAVEAVTLDDVNAFVAAHPIDAPAVLTVGPAGVSPAQV